MHPDPKRPSRRPPWIKSRDTRYREERAEILQAARGLDRRAFLKLSTSVAGFVAAQGIIHPHSFLPVSVAHAAGAGRGVSAPFRFAYISDSHLYAAEVNDRFVRALLRAVDDINALDPQPDFVLYGGDLAQLGARAELDLGAQILSHVKAPLKMMVGEHDWYLDLGARWCELFGAPYYSFDHKGVHFVTLHSVVEEDFWTARGLTPEERMGTVAGLDNGVQNPFTVGAEQRAWLERDLERYPAGTPVIVFSHSPLYKLYKPWNFWTDDAKEVQEILGRFDQVVVLHGHTHQMLSNRIRNIHFHGMLSTAWPWPYAPEGLPELTVQMNRPDPFAPHDGCGDGAAFVHADGLIDKLYSFWNRNPVAVSRNYLKTFGKSDRPAATTRPSY